MTTRYLGGIFLKIYLEEEHLDKFFSNRIVCKKKDWTIHNEFSNEEIDDIGKLMKTRRRPHTRRYIHNFCEYIKREKTWTRWQIECLERELIGKKKTNLSDETIQKLNRIHDKHEKILAKEKEIEKEFCDIVDKIKEKTRYSYGVIRRAIYILYRELNELQPLKDWNNNFLFLFSGKHIKNMLIYNNNIVLGIIVRSARIIYGDELKKEILI